MADDYFAAMNSVEQRLELISRVAESAPLIGVPRTELLALADQLAPPDLALP